MPKTNNETIIAMPMYPNITMIFLLHLYYMKYTYIIQPKPYKCLLSIYSRTTKTLINCSKSARHLNIKSKNTSKNNMILPKNS